MDWCNANVGVGNDLVEEAIKEEREGRNGAVLGEKARNFLEDRQREQLERKKKNGEEKFYAGVDLSKEGQENQEIKEDDEEIVRPPFTLKTPLFVRPKNGKKAEKRVEGDSKPQAFSQDSIDSSNKITKAANDSVKILNLGSSTSEDQESHSQSQAKAKELLSSTEEKEKDIKSKGKSSSLPFGFSTLSSALSTLTGNFSSYMLSLLDQPAYAMLSTRYMSKVFNPRTPNVPSVKYYSIAARTRKLAIYHPLWLPKTILDSAAESRTIGGESDGSAEALGSENQGNDGLVNVQSAKWGEFLGVMEGCDHWDLRGSGGPRWKNDRLDPKTGRIREEHEEKEKKKMEIKDRKEVEKMEKQRKKEEEKIKKEKMKDEERDQSWIDINKLLGSWISKGDAEKKWKNETGYKDQEANKSKLTASAKDKSSTVKESTSKTTSGPTSTSTVSEAANSFLENYATLSSPDEGSQDLSRSSKPSSDASTPTSETSVTSVVPNPLILTPDSALINEVAAWISDRLPERDQERRDLAEKRAEIQDRDGYGLRNANGNEGLGWRGAETFNNQSEIGSKSSLAGNEIGQQWEGSDVAGIPNEPTDGAENKEAEERLTLGSVPILDELNPPPGSISQPSPTTLSSMSTSAQEAASPSESTEDLSSRFVKPTDSSSSSKRETKLRRDAEWMEALGEGAQGRELRRELQWHRAQHVELKSKSKSQIQSSETSSSDSTSSNNKSLGTDPDAPIILDEPDIPPKLSGIRKPSDRYDAYDWDVPNKKRRRELLSAMGMSENSFSELSTSSFGIGTSTQLDADSRGISDRMLVGTRDFNGGLIGRSGSHSSFSLKHDGRKETEKQRREREIKEEEVELERFWLAICRHLWLEGF